MKNWKTIFTALCLFMFFDKSCAQSVKAYFVGHSLVGHTIPNMLEGLAEDDASLSYEASRQVINGSPLKYNWENPASGEVGNYRIDLEKGVYDRLIITEAVPLINHLTWSQTYTMADSFYSYFYRYAKQPKMYIYETWHCINSGTPEGCDWDDNDSIPWRKRLDMDLQKWEGIADSLNTWHSGTEVLMMPGGQAMAALYDAIEAKELSGLSSIADAYHDNIHLNDTGSYYMACVMYSVLFGKSPEGRTVETSHEWGSYNSPGEDLGKKLQQLAWQTVCNYSRSGVDCSGGASVKSIVSSLLDVQIQYFEGKVVISSTADISKVVLRNLSGQKIQVHNAVGTTIRLDNLGANGIYVAEIQTNTGQRLFKKILW